MTEISCFFINLNNVANKIMFVKFDKYFIVKISSTRQITLSIETFMSIQYLFEIYIISLILTKNTSEVKEYHYGDNYEFVINVRFINDQLYYNSNYNDIFIIGKKNMLKKQPPTRESSFKKIRKFVKSFSTCFNRYYPIELLQYVIYDEIAKTETKTVLVELYKNNTIQLLTGIKKKFGRDIYDSIRWHLSS